MSFIKALWYVRRPKTTEIGIAITTFAIWWLADFLHLTLWGLVLLPLPLALGTRGIVIFFIQKEKLLTNPINKKLLKELPFGSFLPFLSLTIAISPYIGALVIQSDLIAKLGCVFSYFVLGAGFLLATFLIPSELNETSTHPEKPLEQATRDDTIFGLRTIGFGLILGGLIGWVDDWVWILVASVGAIAYTYLFNWGAVIRQMSRTSKTA